MKKKKKENKKDSSIEEKMVEIEFICPVRGKVKQLVKGVKYKAIAYVPAQYTAEELLDDKVLEDEEDL